MLGRIGVTLLNTGDMGMADIVRYAQEAEALGYEGFWSTEGDGKDPFIVLGAAAAATRTIHLGTSIASYYSRTPTLMAIAASTLYRMSEGRFQHFGIGTGGVYFTEGGHGVKIAQPVLRAQETIDIIHGLLNNPDQSVVQEKQDLAQPHDVSRALPTHQRFSYTGKLFSLRNFRLTEGPLSGRLPIYVSAIGPKMIAQAARTADGIVTNGLTEESYERYRTLIEREARAVGRDPREIKLYSLTMMGVESPEAVEAVKRALTFFFASVHYYPMMEASGYAQEAREIQRIWRTGDFLGASQVVSEAMVEKFTAMGSVEQRRKKLQWLMEHDVYPILYPVWRPGHTTEDYLSIIRLAASYLATTSSLA